MKRMKLAAAIAASALTLGAAGIAAAAGTAADTTITNTATLSFEVGGLAQPTVAPAAPATFKVDRKVNFAVAYVNGPGYVHVTPGSTGNVISYTVTNTGNDTQDFDLTVAAQNGGAVALTPAGTDTYDLASFKVYKSTSATFDGSAVEITGNTYLDEVAADQTLYVYVVGNTANTRIDKDVAAYTVTAQALFGNGAGAKGGALAENTLVAGLYTVFADTGRNNSEAALGATMVDSAVLSISKNVTPIWDPYNYGTNPRSIPGAYVRYTITISNAGAATTSAVLTTISDTIDATIKVDPDLIKTAQGAAPAPENAAGNGFMVTVPAGRGGAANRFFSTAVNGDADYTAGGGGWGGTVTADFRQLLKNDAGYGDGELKPGETVTLTFNAIIK